MAQIIPNGGTRESQDRYIGPANEITVDQSNQELRVHDGSTAGGHRIPNMDTNDDLYQARSADLDGLKFKPAARGLLVRLQAGAYAIRKLVGKGGVDVEEPDGYGGDITITLGSQITQDMEFTGDVIMRNVLQVDGGVNADTFGDHTGGLDARGATVQFDAKSIPASAIDSPAATSPFAIGMVMMWAGAINAIPAGWRLCDGNGGTPDLSGKFIAGATPDTMLSSGGSQYHIHTTTIAAGGTHRHHTIVHDFTLEEIHMPRHRHSSGVCDQDGNAPFNHGMIGANPQAPESINATSQQPGRFEALTEFTGGGQPHSHAGEVDLDGNHTHAADMDQASNIPPYFCLAYIMRVS